MAQLFHFNCGAKLPTGSAFDPGSDVRDKLNTAYIIDTCSHLSHIKSRSQDGQRI